jgi:PAS domain S-box-containing protein
MIQSTFETLFQHAPNGIILTDDKGLILRTNLSLEVLFGYNTGGLIGSNIESLIPPRFAPENDIIKGISPASTHAALGSLELTGFKKDGTEIAVEISLSPFETPEGVFVIAFVLDNTFRKNYEYSILQQKQALSTLSLELKNANTDLESNVKARTLELEQTKIELLDALSKETALDNLKKRFINVTSHEFRTPLTTVLSSGSLIEQYAERQDFNKIKKHTARIKEAVNELSNILNEFLSLEQLEDGLVTVKTEVVDVASCIAELTQSMQYLLKKGQVFELVHEGQSTVHLDRKLVQSILRHLISNAIKYAPENSTITIKSIASDKDIFLDVQDKGIGIPLDEQQHLFDRFFRASNVVNSTQGTGLGLYIVQKYVELLNGKVGFESMEGMGSSFWVDLPLKV